MAEDAQEQKQKAPRAFKALYRAGRAVIGAAPDTAPPPGGGAFVFVFPPKAGSHTNPLSRIVQVSLPSPPRRPGFLRLFHLFMKDDLACRKYLIKCSIFSEIQGGEENFLFSV